MRATGAQNLNSRTAQIPVPQPQTCSRTRLQESLCPTPSTLIFIRRQGRKGHRERTQQMELGYIGVLYVELKLT